MARNIIVCDSVFDDVNNQHVPSVLSLIELETSNLKIEWKRVSGMFIGIVERIRPALALQINSLSNAFFIRHSERKSDISAAMIAYLQGKNERETETKNHQFIRRLIRKAEPKHPIERDFPVN